MPVRMECPGSGYAELTLVAWEVLCPAALWKAAFHEVFDPRVLAINGEIEPSMVAALR